MSKMPFGKYQEKEIEEIPSDYLRWIVLQSFFKSTYPELLKEAEEELESRDISSIESLLKPSKETSITELKAKILEYLEKIGGIIK